MRKNLIFLALVAVLLTGCGWRIFHWGSPAPALCGPPAPSAPAIPAAHTDPLLGLMAWLSWMSVAAMAGSIVLGVVVSGLRETAVRIFISAVGIIILCRTLGPALPWAPWAGLAIVVGYLIHWVIVNKLHKTALAAVDFGETADDFVTQLRSLVTDPKVLEKIDERWRATKDSASRRQKDLGVKKKIEKLIKKVNA